MIEAGLSCAEAQARSWAKRFDPDNNVSAKPLARGLARLPGSTAFAHSEWVVLQVTNIVQMVQCIP
jgi:hypothetical protein